MGKVLQIVLDFPFHQLLFPGVEQIGRIAVVIHMVRAANLVQNQIPVQKRLHAFVEISHQVVGILLRVAQIILRPILAEFNALLTVATETPHNSAICFMEAIFCALNLNV